ncbi:MerR family DNA-binding transcriptional regulator [Paenibacillus sp. SYP-B3998]|uniref:MerR family DNA-binding transcriptional regulator n=1 Tax=Paenibacillus sp. SYP-B3998 TaxID=2678564 RepID=A0A6G3ZXG0_9BACL|nr:MerR family DNA-binding transcriptional regulator [Paenibacillus sp. SYP-B3998]
MSIQNISNLTGITAHTLRYYEKNGLIHAIARGGERSPQIFNYRFGMDSFFGKASYDRNEH